VTPLRQCYRCFHRRVVFVCVRNFIFYLLSCLVSVQFH